MTSTKITLRKEASDIRASLQAMHDYASAEAAAKHGMKLLEGLAAGSTIGLYWPMGDELDPRFLMHSLSKSGFKTALPVVAQKDAPLEFRQWAMGDPLTEGPYGTSHPADDAPVVMPSVLIVPLLSYDADCYRLGYGGGYYDRTLAAYPVLKAFGFAYAGQFVDDIPREAHDFPMHGIITEAGVVMASK